MSFWQPKSVLQLVLVSFFLALVPLGVAIFFTVQTLSELANTNRDVTRHVVQVTRLGESLQSGLLDLERRARQFEALNEPELAALFERERSQLSGKLRELQEQMFSSNPDVQELLDSLERLKLSNFDQSEAGLSPAHSELVLRSLDSEFSRIEKQSEAVNQWLQLSVDELQRENSLETSRLVNSLILQFSILAVTTFTLLLLCAYWISRPIRDLTEEIHLLGTSGLSHSIEISGPLELQALGGKLEWLRQGLKESEQDKAQFLRHISHELKTPLSSLREGADLLAEQVTGHLSQQQREIVEIVRQNGIALQRLIENLLDYNQLPRQEVNLEDVEVQGLLEALLENYQLTIDKKVLRLSLSGKLLTWCADRYKLATALDNIISNAINYTPDGGLIDIQWNVQDSHLVIDVANSGQTIPEEDSERIFEPFFQSHSRRSGPIKGSGIGLSVARECIEAQGGRLFLATHPELPTCFRLICAAQS